jgi:hypothetical protein
MTNTELAALVETLQAENARLRSEMRAAEQEAAAAEAAAAAAVAAAANADRTPLETSADDRVAVSRRRRARARATASVALVLIGLLLVPAALVGSWAKGQLTDTEAFVATFAPLAEDEAVKALVVDEVMAVVNEQVDFERATGEVFDAVGSLGIPASAKAALEALKRPAALGLSSLATGVVTDFVDSEAFESIWAQALRISHQQLVAAMTDDPSAALTISSSGELALQLGPVIDAVKTALVAQGLDLASAIPSVDLQIVIAEDTGFSQLALLYGLAVTIGQWLPLVALALLVAGLVAARRRIVALVRASIAFVVVVALVGVGLQVGGVITVAGLAAYLPMDAARAIYSTVTSLLASTIVAMIVLGVTVALIGWVLGPWRPAPALRRAFADGAARLRRAGDARGITTGAAGRVLERQRVLVRAVIAVGAASIVLFVRPIGTAQIVWTAVVAVLLLVVVELLRRPVVIEATAETPETTVRMELRG